MDLHTQRETIMAYNEETMLFLEQQIPDLAESAFNKLIGMHLMLGLV